MFQTTSSGWRGIAAIALLLVAVLSHAQGTGPTRVAVKPGAPTVVVDTVPCAKDVLPPEAARIVTFSDSSAIIVRAPADQGDERSFAVSIGNKLNAAGTDCEGTVISRQYIVSFNPAPEVSGQALQKSFEVLVAALVLALLLESAFALLFNYRPFNVMLVGRAVRTPIMLAGAWLVVSQFKFDLMAQLFNAYYPREGGPTSSIGTSLLTAMILAGGSVGVNRLLTNMGFRSPFKDGEVLPKVDDKHAWVAVEVEPAERGQRAVVSITECTPPEGANVETTVGVAGNARPTLRSIFRGSNYRVPASGGLQVDASKYYTVTVRDLNTGNVYDATGIELKPGTSASVFHFGPRAIMDFRIKLPA